MPKLTPAQRRKKLAELGKSRRQLVTPFPNDTKEKKAARIEKAKADMFYFGHTYFPHYFTDESPDFHREWSTLADIINRLVLVLAPRGHGKSVIFSLVKILHWIITQNRHLIVLASDTADQAEGLLSFVRAELEENERLRHDFGDLRRPGAWTDSEIITTTGVMVVAKGKGQKMRGLRNGPHRPDAFVGDDIENDEEQNNPQRVQKTLRWLRNVVMPAMNPKGHSIIVVGTLLSLRSALGRLREMKKEGADTPLYECRLYRGAPPGGPILWPQRFPPEYLARLREEMGAVAFNAEINNDPRDEEGKFQETWFQEWRPADHVQTPITDVVIYTDPSMGETKKHDAKATIALGRCGKHEDILAARIRKESVAAMINAVFDIYEGVKADHPTARIVVAFEKNGFQELLKEPYEAEERERGYTVPLKMVVNTQNKMARIESLSSPIERGIIRVRRNHTDQDTLIEQLLYIDSGAVNDDGPDALDGAHRLLFARRKNTRPEYETVKRRRRLGIGSVRGGLEAV